MEPERVTICSYCIELTTDHSNANQLRHCSTLKELRLSSIECAICNILLGCFDEQAKDASRRFAQIKASVAEQCPLSLILSSGDKHSESKIIYKCVEARIAFPNKFTYVWKFQIGVCERSALPLMSEVWSTFPSNFEAKLERARKWLHACQDSHPECRPKWQCHLPKRLIELEVSDTTDDITSLRLVYAESLGPDAPKYTTLSYCCGNISSLKTTKESVYAYHEEIPRDELPKSFLDAAIITKSLGLRYLWIDALCVVGDDHDDRTTEVSKMDNIYHGSTLTISSIDSEAPSGDVFVQRVASVSTRTSGARAFLRATDSKNQKEIIIHLVPGSDVHSALDGRCWTLQESVLSPRAISVTNSELKWRCGSGTLWESGIPYTYGYPDYEHSLSLVASQTERRKHIWWTWVENYLRRRLTFQEDRLPAILGLINYYQRMTQDISALGLWKSTLPEDLTWMRIATRSDRSPDLLVGQNLPSWSPFSCAQSVSFTFWPHKIGQTEPCIDIANFRLSWEGTPYLSKVQTSSLVIDGALQEIHLAEATEVPGCNPPYFNVDNEEVDIANNPLPWRCVVQWDTEGHRPPQNWMCLLVRRSVAGEYELAGEVFLVLESVSPQTYRRVGIGALNCKPTADGVAKQVWRFDREIQSRIILV